MGADFVIKAGDTSPVLTDTLSYSNGQAANLTEATLSFVMRSLTAAAPLSLTGAAAIVEGETGKVAYTFSAADTATTGLYMANWIVTFPGDVQMTWPTVGYLSVSVEESLATAGGQQLVGLPDVKDYLAIGATDRSHDAKLIRFIEAVTPLIENVTGPILPRRFTEWHNGGQTFIIVRRRPSSALGASPILRLVEVTEWRGPIEYQLSIIQNPGEGEIYSCMLEPKLGHILRTTTGGGVIAFSTGNMDDRVRVIYEAGQEKVPANVYEAALEAIRVNYRLSQPTGIGADSMTDTYESGAPLGFFLPRRCLDLLSPNRRGPAVA